MKRLQPAVIGIAAFVAAANTEHEISREKLGSTDTQPSRRPAYRSKPQTCAR